MATSQAIENIAFGELIIDPKGRRVLRGGQRLAMGPQEFKLLETLIANRGRVLTGDELRILVWSDDPSKNMIPAGDVNALYVSIRKLRSALGDHGKYILNIPKVGYTISDEPFTAHESIAPEPSFNVGSPFIGRGKELEQVLGAIGRSRIVTLTGPPGIGKSRLAAEAARFAGANFSSAICFVDLASIEDEQFVGKAALTSLGLTEHAGSEADQEVIQHLKEKQVLLVLDNCDHLIEAATKFANKVLRACRGVHIVATSREPMQLPGETVITVGPLEIPASGHNGVLQYDAVKLFVELAKQRRPDFEIGERDVPGLVELCRQLEGIPVAIELAAVQVDAYTVDQILSVMKDRLRVLQRRGGESSRYQTLEGAIDWSYGLLSEEEKLLLQRLSVFSGGWTTETAAAVCTGDGVGEDDVVHLLAGLVRRSLIQLGTHKGFHRYRMLEMIRQFSRRRLVESGSENQMRNRHTATFLNLAETAFEAGEKDEWPAIIEAEYDNIRAVLRRTIKLGEDVSSGLRLCGFLVRFWFNHGHLNEARQWTTEALDKDDGSDPEARARALVSAGFFFGQMPGSGGDALQGKKFFEESLEIFRRIGNSRNTGFALQSYSFLLNRLGDFEKAIECAEEALETFRPLDDHANSARAANNLGLTLMDTGEFSKARAVFEMALKSVRRAKDKYLEAVVLHNLGDASFLTGDLDSAEQFLGKGLELFRPLEHRALVARTILLQGEVLAARSNFDAALEHEKNALQQFVDLGDNQGIASALEAIGSTLAAAGNDLAMAAKLLASAGALRKKINIALGPSRQMLVDSTFQRLQKHLGTEQLTAIQKTAVTAPTSNAVDYVIAFCK